MVKFILMLSPALIPILMFFIWRRFRRGKGAKENLSARESFLWRVSLIVSLAIAIVCIVVIGVSGDRAKRGEYIPPQYEDGKMVPGKVIPTGEHN